MTRGLDEYGIPLTRSERRELARRATVSEAAGVLQRRLRADDERFAGAWIDHRSGGIIRLAFTRDQSSALAAARTGFAYPGQLRAVAADRSLRHLEGLRARIMTVRRPIGKVLVTGAGTDVKRNRVTVKVLGDLAAARAHFRRYGDAVSVTRGVARQSICAKRDNCGSPYRGGLVLDSPDLQTSCTSGFVAYKSALPLTPAESPSSAPDYFLLSAGHCDDGRTGANWLHNNEVVGPMIYNSWDDDPLATELDFLGIPITDAQAANWIYTRSTSNPYPVRAVKELGTDMVDDVVCISVPYAPEKTRTWREGGKCGFITQTDHDYIECADGTHPGTCQDDQVQGMDDQLLVQMGDTPGVRPGDSGGPAFSNSPNTARGIIHGNEINDFTHLDTNEVIIGKIGYLFPMTENAMGPGDPGLRVLTTVGPGGGTP